MDILKLKRNQHMKNNGGQKCLDNHQDIFFYKKNRHISLECLERRATHKQDGRVLTGRQGWKAGFLGV